MDRAEDRGDALTTLIATLILLAIASPTNAQDGGTDGPDASTPTIPVSEISTPTATPADDAREPGQLQEIVVTANKRGELRSDVPASVSVMTGDDLASLAASSFQDFATYMPGVSSSSRGAGENQIVIRGVTSGAQTSATVGVYVDESPVGSSSAFAFGIYGLDFNTFDLQRVEMLSGPQGTLYGASTLGGLIKYVTTPPDPENIEASVQVDGSGTESGGFNRSYRAMGNVPLEIGGIPIGIRASGFTEDGAGFVDNPSRGLDDVDESTSRGGRMSVLGRLTPNLTARLGAATQKIRRDGSVTVDYDPATHEPVDGEYDQGARVDEPFLTRDRRYTGVVTWSGEWGNVTSASSYQLGELENTFDQTRALGGFFHTGNLVPFEVFTGSSLRKFTQEIRLESLESDFLDWQVGGFYTRERALATAQLTGLFLDPALVLIPGLDPDDLAVDPSVTLLFAQQFTHYKEQSVFADTTVHFTETFDLTVGARYAVNHQTFRQENSGVLGTIPSDESQKKSHEDVTTYLVNPRYRLFDSTILYARIASGYRPGGPNFVLPPPFPPPPPTFDADTVWNYELGVKVVLGRQATLDFDVYYIRWNDIQLLVNHNTVNDIENGGRARIVGAELAMGYLVMPGLNVAGNVSYTRSQLTEDSAALEAESGSPLPLSPRYSAAATTDYRFAIGGAWTGNAGLSYRFVGKRPSGFDGSTVHPQYWLERYHMVDARAGLQWNRLELGLYLKNVLNAHAGVSADASALQYDAMAPVRVAAVQPRTLGVTLTYRLD